MTIQSLAPTLTTTTAPRSITRYAATGARVLLDLVFFVCGLDGFLHFLPQPTEPPSEGAMADRSTLRISLHHAATDLPSATAGFRAKLGS